MGAAEEIRPRQGVADQTGGGGQSRQFTIKASQRKPFERCLRDLYTIGYLSDGPENVDGVWDAGSQKAEDEFKTLEQYKGISEGLLAALTARYNEIFFDVDLRGKKADVHAGQGASEYLHVWTYEGRMHVPLFEAVQLSLLRKQVSRSGTRRYHVVIQIEGGPKVLETDIDVSGEDRHVMLEPLAKGLTADQLKNLDVETPATIKVTTSVTAPNGETRNLEIEEKLLLLTLKHVVLFESDDKSAFWICDLVANDLRAVKDDMKALSADAKLILASTIRTWSLQVKLWKRYKSGDPRQKNPAAQPGDSWHHTGRAIDIDVWNLNIKSGYAAHIDLIHKILKDKDANLEFSADDPKLYEAAMFAHEQLQQARALFHAHDFELCGASWKQFPWNKGFMRHRRGGTIASVEAISYSLYFAPTRLSHKADTGRPVVATTTTLRYPAPGAATDPAAAPLEISLGADASRPPRWIDDKKSKKKVLEWRVSGAQIGDRRQYLEDCFNRSSIVLTWTGADGAAHTVEANGVEMRIDAVRIRWQSKEGALPAGEAAIPIASRVKIKDGKFLQAASDPQIDAARTGATMDVAFSVLCEALGQKDLDDMALADAKLSFVTENRTLDANGAHQPAFQHTASEKHHYQNEKRLEGGAASGETIKRMNAAVDKFNEVLVTIPKAWCDKNGKAPPAAAAPAAPPAPPDTTNMTPQQRQKAEADHRKRVQAERDRQTRDAGALGKTWGAAMRGIKTRAASVEEALPKMQELASYLKLCPAGVVKVLERWTMFRYGATDPVVLASTYIGNFPQPDAVEKDLEELSGKIKDAALGFDDKAKSGDVYNTDPFKGYLD